MSTDPAETRVRSVRTRTYMKLLAELHPEVQPLINATYENRFKINPFGTALQGSWYRHRLEGRRVFRVALPRHHRALAFYEESTRSIDGRDVQVQTFIWWWVGTHESYNGVKDRVLVSSGAS